MTWKIDKLVLGERPTLIEADKGNELIAALNKLSNITIQGGQNDAVEYTADGVVITWGKFLTGESFSGTLRLLDAEDITQRYFLTIQDNMIVASGVESSGWVEKEIEICEDGSAETYTFLVKS